VTVGVVANTAGAPRQFQRDPEAIDFYLAMQFVVDRLAPQLREGELRVLLFIVRQTAGWGKVRDTISIGQLMDGIGDREGTGMEKRAVIRSYKSLEAKGLIHIIRTSCKGGSLPLTFELTLPMGERGKPRVSGKIAMQTRMTPLEGDRRAESVRERPRPALALVDSGGGVPKATRSKPRVVSQRHQGGIPKTPGWGPKDTGGGIPKTPTILETTLENNTRETTTTTGLSSSSSSQEVIVDNGVRDLVAEAYQVFDGALPAPSTIKQWAVVAQGYRDAAGEEIGEEEFAGYCRLAATTTARSCTVKSPGSRVKYFLGTLDRMLHERPPLERRPSEEADDYLGSAYAHLYS
jgi:hypothetical protein